MKTDDQLVAVLEFPDIDVKSFQRRNCLDTQRLYFVDTLVIVQLMVLNLCKYFSKIIRQYV